MDRKRSLYFGSLVLFLCIYRGICEEEEEDEPNYRSYDHNDKHVFHGKGVVLYCNVDNKNPDEVENYKWLFNNKELFSKTKQIKNNLFKGKIDLLNKDPFSLNITEATIEMGGRYKCQIFYKNGEEQYSEFDLLVIKDPCLKSFWKFSLNEELCEETLEMKCEGIFPKPHPQCILKANQDKLSITPHIEQLEDSTFKISINTVFKKKDYPNVTDITLDCMLLFSDQSDTGYKFGIDDHEMFGERGCPTKYPEAGDGYVNATNIEKTCWDQAANGSSLTYYCNNDKVKSLVCKNDAWMDESEEVEVGDRPYCTDGADMEKLSTFSILVAVMLYYY